MKYYRFIILIPYVFLLVCQAFAQFGEVINVPEIGKTCPPFLFPNVEGSLDKSISNKEMRGKYFILDFWNLHCLACIESLEYLNTVQQKYKDRLKIILVGTEDSRTKSFYKGYQEKKNLKLTSEFNSGLFEKFHVYAVPHEIWIDSSGIVRAITLSDAVTEENIQAFINAKTFAFQEKKESNLTIDFTKPILVNGNGGNDSNFYYRSLLGPFLDMQGFSCLVRDSTSRLVVNSGILNLYSVAFGGMVPYPNMEKGWPFPYNRITLEVKDSSRFLPPYKNGLFFYELDVPKPVTVNVREFMRSDLSRLFNLKASLEKRMMKVMILICTDSTKLFTTDEPSNVKDSIEGFSMQNEPIKILSEKMEDFLGGKMPLIDETHYSGKADIHFRATLTDLEDVRLALKPFGLDIIVEERLMDMLIIRDKTYSKDVKG